VVYPRLAALRRAPEGSPASVSSGTFGIPRASVRGATGGAGVTSNPQLLLWPTGWDFYGQAFQDVVSSITSMRKPAALLMQRLLNFCPSTANVEAASPSVALYVCKFFTPPPPPAR